MEIVLKNKTFLIDILSTDASMVLQHAQSDNIITQRDYNKLNQLNHTGEKIIINFLDTVMNKDDETCKNLLQMLGKKEFVEIFPRLKELTTSQQTSHKGSEERENGAAVTQVSEKSTGSDFVDKHRESLIQRVPSVMEIADGLLSKQMLTYEVYNNIAAEATPQKKMRMLLHSLDSKAVKEEFYRILKRKQPFLVEDLEK